MQDFVYSHAKRSAKTINLHDLSSDWINLMENPIRNKTCPNRTCPIACGKHMWNKFQFPPYVFLTCNKNIYGKHTVETFRIS